MLLYFFISLITFLSVVVIHARKVYSLVARDEREKRIERKKGKKKTKMQFSGERSSRATMLYIISLFIRDLLTGVPYEWWNIPARYIALRIRMSVARLRSGWSDDRLFSAWGTFEMVLEQWNLYSCFYMIQRLAVTIGIK